MPIRQHRCDIRRHSEKSRLMLPPLKCSRRAMHDIALGTGVKAEKILERLRRSEAFENGGVNDGVDGGPRLY